MILKKYYYRFRKKRIFYVGDDWYSYCSNKLFFDDLRRHWCIMSYRLEDKNSVCFDLTSLKRNHVKIIISNTKYKNLNKENKI